MKRPIFFVFGICLVLFSCGPVFLSKTVAEGASDRNIVFKLGEESRVVTEKELQLKPVFGGQFSNAELLTRVKGMGFSSSETLKYVYPELEKKLEKIVSEVNQDQKNSYVEVTSGAPKVVAEVVGRKVDENQLLEDLFSSLKKVDGEIIQLKTELLLPDITTETTNNLTNLKSKFTTYIYGVNQEGRIHNIRQATSKFNGLILMPGEKLSFNKTIGETTAENGYALAKVILNGKYEEDYGGGVCQVATTLYNASLMAGLKIERVAPHSLKVGYVAGSFDAMVSHGISDLVISNPYSTPVYIHTYATDAECGVKIFGVKNDFDIVRRAEILDISDEEAENISYKSEGYLDFYKEGELVRSQKIRQDKYKRVKINEN